MTRCGWIVAALAVALGGSAPARPAPPASVDYVIAPHLAGGKYVIDVTMTWQGTPAGHESIDLPLSSSAAYQELVEVDSIRLAGGRFVRKGTSLTVEYRPDAPLVLQYTVRSNGAPISASIATSFGLTPRWFAGYAWGVLATPVGRDAQPARLRWSASAAGVPHIDTFETRNASVAKIGQTLIAGGPGMRRKTLAVGGRPADLMSFGATPPGGDAAFEAMMRQIIGEGRQTLPGDTDRPYAIVMVWVPGLEGNFGAAAYDRGILASGNTLKPLEYFREHFQHEVFHYWIETRMGGARAEHGDSQNWVSEGLNEATTYRSLLRHGHMTLDAYVAHLNAVLKSYTENPARKLSRAALDAAHDVDASKLPYKQGEIIGLLLDQGLREASGKRLEDALRTTIARNRSTPNRPAPVNFTAALAELGLPQADRQVAALTAAGQRLALPADLFAGCVTVSPPPANDDAPAQTVALVPGLSDAARARCTALIGG